MPNSRSMTCNTQYFLDQKPSRHARADGSFAPPFRPFAVTLPTRKSGHPLSEPALRELDESDISENVNIAGKHQLQLGCYSLANEPNSVELSLALRT